MRTTGLCPTEAWNLMKARGSFVDGGMMFERWMKDCPLLEDVHYKEIYTPIGPWVKGADKS